MRTTPRLITGCLALAAALLAPAVGAQEQRPNSRGWPCGGRLDPSYFATAEATGGHIALVSPAEMGAEAAELLTTFMSHPQTLFRLAGDIKAGVHEFHVPIDPSVESVVFSISVQCLQTAAVARPSGAALVAGEGVTDLSNFSAHRMMTVTRPEAGVWTVRAGGTGIAAVVVQGRSAIRIHQVRFAVTGSREFGHAPAPGTENVISIGITGRVSDLQASLVTAGFRRIASLPLMPGESEGSFLARFTPGTQDFRILVEGKDDAGVPFQRVHAPLFMPAR